MSRQSIPTLVALLVALLLTGSTVAPAADQNADTSSGQRRSPFADGTTTLGQGSTVSTSGGTTVSAAVGNTAAAAPAAAQAGSGRYVVVSGDSLWKIAQRFLGNGARYWDIVEANKDRYPSILKNPNLIHPGWEFVIPGVTIPAADTRSASTSPGGSQGNTPTPDPVGLPAAGAKGGKALLGWLQATGLTGENLRIAWAVGMKESSGNPRAFNGNAATGDKSYGLFQINMIGSMGPARLKQYGLSSNEDLFDPVINCRCMMKLSKNGTNWGPWGIGPNSYKKTQSSPQYEKFYNAYPPK